MNTFIMKRKIGDNWYTLPAQLIGGDETGITAKIMDRFTGIVFDVMRAGTFDLPPMNVLLPNGDEMQFSIAWINRMNIVSPLKACVGFMILEDLPIFNEGEFIINTVITNEEQELGAYECSFSIENNLITNFTWRNSNDMSNSLIIRNLEFNSNSKCFPLIFAFNDSEEFTDNYMIDEVNNQILYDYGIDFANWVKPNDYVEIQFAIDEDEFNKPNKLIALKGNKVTLPDYNSLFCKNYIPLKWRIENVEYPLGGAYTLPQHDVTAELIYEVKNYSGVII